MSEFVDVLGEACRSCGCTDDDGCTPEEGGPCFWVAPDLCSACYRQQSDYAPRYEDALLDSELE